MAPRAHKPRLGHGNAITASSARARSSELLNGSWARRDVAPAPAGPGTRGVPETTARSRWSMPSTVTAEEILSGILSVLTFYANLSVLVCQL